MKFCNCNAKGPTVSWLQGRQCGNVRHPEEISYFEKSGFMQPYILDGNQLDMACNMNILLISDFFHCDARCDQVSPDKITHGKNHDAWGQIALCYVNRQGCLIYLNISTSRQGAEYSIAQQWLCICFDPLFLHTPQKPVAFSPCSTQSCALIKCIHTASLAFLMHY